MKEDYTRKMLNTLRNMDKSELNRKGEKILNENDMSRKIIDTIKNSRRTIVEDNEKENTINLDNISAFKTTIDQWKDNIKQTVQSNIDFDSIVYSSDGGDIFITYKITDMGNTKVQMRYLDDTGNGLYIWMNGIQINDTNLQKIEHIKASYDNWRTSLIKDNTILSDIKSQLDKN
jgi:hypothetical protein